MSKYKVGDVVEYRVQDKDRPATVHVGAVEAVDWQTGWPGRANLNQFSYLVTGHQSWIDEVDIIGTHTPQPNTSPRLNWVCNEQTLWGKTSTEALTILKEEARKWPAVPVRLYKLVPHATAVAKSEVSVTFSFDEEGKSC